MVDTNVSFQDESHGLGEIEVDWNDAAIFAQAAYDPNDIDYKVQGFEFDPDFNNDVLNVNGGWAKIYKPENQTLNHTDDQGIGQTAKTLLDAVHPAQVSSVSGVVLGSGVENHIWLEIDLSEGNGASIYANRGNEPALPHIKLGTVHTGDETYDDTLNRLPDGDYNNLSAQSATVDATPSDPKDVFRLQDYNPPDNTHIDISDEGGKVLEDVSDVRFLYGLGVTDDGDGSVSVERTTLPGSSGKSTQSGDGSTTTFSIFHGLTKTPNHVNVEAQTEAASADYWVNYDSSNIYVHYASPPPEGGNNLKWHWSALPEDGQPAQSISSGAEGIHGESTRSGDGSTTTFYIPHNLEVDPAWVNVEAQSIDASADRQVRHTSTNIIIEYSAAPASGSGNLEWEWAAVTSDNFHLSNFDHNHSGDQLAADRYDLQEYSSASAAPTGGDQGIVGMTTDGNLLIEDGQ